MCYVPFYVCVSLQEYVLVIFICVSNEFTATIWQIGRVCLRVSVCEFDNPTYSRVYSNLYLEQYILFNGIR